MEPAKIISDIVTLIKDAGPLPTISDRGAVKAFLGRVVPDLVDLTYDAGGFDAVKAALESHGTVAAEAEAPGKIGDGKILQWVVTNLPQILAIISALIPK